MDGNHLIIKMGVNDLKTRHKKFSPNNQCHCAAHEKHNEREPQIKRTNIFVVSGKQPTRNTLWYLIVMMVCNRCSHTDTPVKVKSLNIEIGQP